MTAVVTPALADLDRHLIAEGRHERLWEVLGAHVVDDGVRFALWAPGARAVRVCGEWGEADLVRDPLIPVWQAVVPEAGEGHRYRFRILCEDDVWRDKADPMAFRTTPPPAVESVVTRSRHAWSDGAWWHRPDRISVYEVHLGSWRAGLGYREAAERLADHVAGLGFTHVELLPLAEHPYGGSWGYQVTSYYAPTARYGSPDDLRHLVDVLHRRGIGVILDWVPAHFPKDDWALGRLTGVPVYEHPDPRRGEHPDWGTYVFDFGRPEVRNFLLANALYWLEEFHVDGLRVDAVSSMLYRDYSRGPGEWEPNEHGGNENLEALAFLRELTATAGRLHPDALLIAEESTTWPGVTAAGGLGFDRKWNLGWMHDTLTYFRDGDYERLKLPAEYAWSERYLLPLSHDEVVHGKGSLIAKTGGAAGLRVLLAHMWAHPGGQVLFMGGEIGQPHEWADHRELAWDLLDDPVHAGVARLVAALNRVQAAHPALYRADDRPDGFEWLVDDDPSRAVVAFTRRAPGAPDVVCVANFGGPRAGFRLPLPSSGVWRVLLHTEDVEFGGDGAPEAVVAVPEDGRAVAELALPARAAVWLTRC
ncbi:1,4-alpha-glucan branching enzyme [Saccharothrix saharensis]|uniref:1,4-alpha-glucan branching enzyme n=1 Tax=Saccharothrix saharensis TaxID=571190 RepID=A0A543JAK0_9PSEU|nr:1,4-alpha-glucan branching protein GlgB [Saccharothrix saharensis]TQM79824.1 1,4-alpha-glucan branching enzyme [Saccharothrix saharensis]